MIDSLIGGDASANIDATLESLATITKRLEQDGELLRWIAGEARRGTSSWPRPDFARPSTRPTPSWGSWTATGATGREKLICSSPSWRTSPGRWTC